MLYIKLSDCFIAAVAPYSAIYSAGGRKRPPMRYPTYPSVTLKRLDMSIMVLSSGPAQCGRRALPRVPRQERQLDYIPHSPVGKPSPQAAPCRLRWWSPPCLPLMGYRQFSADGLYRSCQSPCHMHKAGSVQFHRLSIRALKSGTNPTLSEVPDRIDLLSLFCHRRKGGRIGMMQRIRI